MVRIRLLAGLLSLPSGHFHRGFERDASEEEAAALLASGQWERVAPPLPPEPDAKESEKPAAIDAEWTGEPEPAADSSAPSGCILPPSRYKPRPKK